MYIYSTLTVTFDPKTEYDHAVQYGIDNPDWKKEISTVAISYTKSDRYVAELKESE